MRESRRTNHDLAQLADLADVAAAAPGTRAPGLAERHGASALVDEIHYVELSDRPDFNDRFIEQLAFPQ